MTATASAAVTGASSATVGILACCLHAYKGLHGHWGFQAQG
jgi:hypothetical protein